MRLFFFLFFCLPNILLALTSEWAVDADGDWGDGTNWDTNPLFPNAIDDTANFLTVITGDVDVTLDINITIGTINIDDDDDYTIDGAEILTFDVSAGTAALNVSDANGAGSHEISSLVVFNDTLTMTHTSTADFEISGDISGAGGLTKEGTGTGDLILSGTNTYLGATAINTGNVLYDVDGSIPSASVVTVGNGAAPAALLTIDADMTAPNAFVVTVDSDGTLTQDANDIVRLTSLAGSGAVNLSIGAGNDSLFDILGSPSTTFSGIIALGALNASLDPDVGNRLTKTGTSTLTLTGANTYISRTFISNGIINVRNASALGVAGASSATNVQSGGTLEIQDSITIPKTIRINGTGFSSGGAIHNVGGSNTISGPVTIGWAGGTEVAANATIQVDGSTTLTISSVIDGANNLTKTGAGTLSFTGASANTYTGDTFVNAGTLDLDKTGAEAVIRDITIGGGTLFLSQADQIANTTSNVTLNTGTFNMNGNAETINSLTFNGGTLTQGGATLTLGDATTALTMRDTTVSGDIDLTGGGDVVFDATNNGTATISGNLDLGAAIIEFDIANGTAANDMSISGVISNGSLTKIGAGTLELSGTNSYLGDTLVNVGTLDLNNGIGNAIAGDVTIGGGTLFLSQANQIVDTSDVTLNSGTFNMNGNADTIGSFTFNAGTFTQGGAPLTLASAVTALTMRDTTISGNIALTGGGDVDFDATNDGTATISGNLDLGAAIIDFNIADGTADNDMSISGAISNGGLTKIGTGTLELSGVNSLGSASTVSAGTLLVNNTLGGAGDLTVSSGATLKGVGPINKNITVNGNLEPGGSIDTMIVVGDVIQASGSTLEIELTPTTNDLLDITGTYTIEPSATLNVDAAPGNYESIFSHVIVNTTGGVTGVFSTVTVNLPLFEGTVTYTPLQVLLEMADLPFESLGFKGNAKQMARCLDTFDPPAGSDLAFILNALRMLPTVQEIKDALLRMQPSAFSSLALAQENATIYMRNTVFQHMERRLHACCCSCDPNPCNCWCIWATGLQGWTKQGNKKEEPGYKGDTPGVFVGLDRYFCDDLLFGIGVGYTRTHFDWRKSRGRAKIHSTYATLYGQWTPPCAFLEAALTGGYNSYNQHRRIKFTGINRTAKSHHNGLEGSVHLRGGGRFDLDLIKFSPFASLDYIYLHEDSYKEKGAQSLNLKIKEKNSDILIGEAGLDIAACFICDDHEFTPFVQLSGIYEKRYDGKKVKSKFNGCPLNVKGLYPSRGLFGYAAGVNYSNCCHDLGINLIYQGKRRHDFSDNAVYVELKKCF